MHDWCKSKPFFFLFIILSKSILINPIYSEILWKSVSKLFTTTTLLLLINYSDNKFYFVLNRFNNLTKYKLNNKNNNY